MTRTTYTRTPWLLGGLLPVLAAAGCILEDNPAFVDTDGMATGSFTDTLPTGSGPGSSPGSDTTSSSDPTSATETGGTDSDDTATTGPAGCEDRSCVEVHVGPAELACDREVDGVFEETCDFYGDWALKVAVSAVGYEGGGRVFVHDDHGMPAVYQGGIDLEGNTLVAPHEDTPRQNIIIEYAGDPVGAAMRMIGPSNHVRDLTLVLRSGGQHAFEFRSDPDVEDTETAGHIIEGVVIAATENENLASNSISHPLSHLGPDTIIRNTYTWGYFEVAMDLTRAHGTKLHHNTWVSYQYQRAGDPVHLFDASDVQDLEVSNNVFVSVTNAIDTVLIGTDATVGGVFSGNIVEGADAFVVGIPPGDPQNVIADNVLGEAPLESPYNPRVLSDAESNADAENGTLDGVSLDGVDLATASAVVPGAFQNRSERSSPRRMTVRLGPSGDDCGGSGCDVTDDIEDAMQVAVWTVWPGGVLELHPSTYGGGVISWPIEIRGMGAQPDEVVLRRQSDGFLGRFDAFQDEEILRVLHHQSQGIRIRNLTLSAAPDIDGLVVEGSNDEGDAPPTPHLLERIRVIDEGDTAEDLAERAFFLGSNVVLRNSLVIGGFENCITFGVRNGDWQTTPPTTGTVQNFTCRLTVPHVDEAQEAFQVASVVGTRFINLAVELTDGGPVFKAQRRSSDDEDPIALDPPESFSVDSASVLGADPTFDGFTDAEGTYTLTDVDVLLDTDPLFVGPADSHLDPLATSALDNGIDPSTIDASLDPGIALDGVDRSQAAAIDRGCYEEGL